MGNSGEQLVRNWIKKLNVVTYITTKLRFFTSYLSFFAEDVIAIILVKKKEYFGKEQKNIITITKAA